MMAGIYAGRGGLEPVLLTGPQPGGLLANATEIENFPGFPDGIATAELINNIRQQAENFEVDFRSQTASEVELSAGKLIVKAGDEVYEPQSLIVATGALPKRLGLKDEDKLQGKGVSYCATCDGFFYRGQEIAVVGGGNTALEEALFLTRFASRVYLIHRRSELRGSKLLQEKVFQDPKIQVIWDTVIRGIEGADDNKLKELLLYNKAEEGERRLQVRGLFVAIGYQPNTHLFWGQLELDDHGFIITDRGGRTSVEGVFAAGDVQDPHYQQAVTAAASGARAALEVENFLHG